MRSSVRTLAVSLVTVLGLTATPATAYAGARTWTLCIPTPFRSCASIFVKTTPTGTGGTQFLVSVHNFQGQGMHGDNIEWSAITEVSFWDIIGEPASGMGIESGSTSGTPLGGATGPSPTYSWQSIHGNGPGLGTVIVQNPAWPSTFGVMGCDFGPYGGGGFGQPGVKTCVPGSHVDFSFTTAQSWEATEFGSLRLSMLGWKGFPAGGYAGFSCQSNPSLYPPITGGTNCDVISVVDGDPSVVPEPASVALLATGMIALGVMVRRKRLNN